MARGHIRERSGPRGKAWEIHVRAGNDPATGKPRRITRTVRGPKAEAERQLTRLLAEVDEGGHTGPDATLAHLLEEWVKVKRRSWSPKNAIETQGYIDRWIAPPAEHPRWHWSPGRQRIRDVTPRLLDEFNRRLLDDEGLAPATVRRMHGVTRAALEQAVRWDWLMRNPAARCEPVEGQSAEVVPPAVEDVRQLLRATADEPTLHLFVRLAVVTGRRRGELCALRWSDVNWEARSMIVSRTIVDAGPGQWVERPISKNTRRFPPLALGAGTLTLLKQHQAVLTEQLAEIGTTLPADGWIFQRVTGVGPVPWSPDAASRRFSRACEAAGLGGFHLHSLRHLSASSMLDGGISPTTAGGRLGHGGGGRTTAAVYAHQVPATDQAAAELLEALADG